MLRLLPLSAQCSFHASVSSFKILLGYIENSQALNQRLSRYQPKTIWGISNFDNVSTAMASDVTHISKFW